MKKLRITFLHAMYRLTLQTIQSFISFSLMQDGWSDIHNSPVIATALFCEAKPYFSGFYGLLPNPGFLGVFFQAGLPRAVIARPTLRVYKNF